MIEAGQRLAKKKESLKHGEWLPWIEANTEHLGFDSRQTASRLMKLAGESNGTSTHHLTETQSLQISRNIWGNSKDEPKKKKSSGSGSSLKGKGSKGVSNPRNKSTRSTRQAVKGQLEKAQDIVRPMVHAGLTINYRTLGKEHGMAHATFEKATAIEEKLYRAELDKIDLEKLPANSKKVVAAAVKQETRKVQAEHAARMREIDEEIRLKVVENGKTYLERLQKRESDLESREKYIKIAVQTHKPPFTADEFKSILMCLHPDGQRTSEKLSEAFRLFNAKKLNLTGEK